MRQSVVGNEVRQWAIGSGQSDLTLAAIGIVSGLVSFFYRSTADCRSPDFLADCRLPIAEVPSHVA
jgi:hypothetical protein